jgi:polysaccharide chain length determinant protein (PEP-CTERM system associated)
VSDLRTQILAQFRAIWRRRWYVALVAWLFCVLGWLTILALPDRFESRTRIYVDTTSLLSPLLSGITMSGFNLDQKVLYMKRTLLSRPNLAKVVRATDMDLAIKNESDMERLLDKLAAEVEVRSQGQDLFTIAFAHRNPQTAQRVVQSLLNIFVESNLGENRTEMEKARAFVEAQIAQYERQLSEAETRLAKFKTDNMEMLSNAGTYVQRMESARQELQTATAAYQDIVLMRDQLRLQLAAIPQYLSIDQQPQVIVNAGGAMGTPLQLRIQELEKSLDSMLSQYTDQHPDVLATRRILKKLQLEREAEVQSLADAKTAAAADGQGGPPKSSIPNPVYEQVKLRLVDADSQLVARQRKVEQAKEDIARFGKLAATAPEIEAKHTALDRDYGVIKRNYEQLLGRRESAKMAQAVDAETDIQFRIVDPPEVPNVPVGPNRKLFLTIVLVAALGSGVALAYLLSQLDVSFASMANLREAFGLPVLGAVSVIAFKGRRRLRAAEVMAFTACLLVLTAAFGGVLLTEAKLHSKLKSVGVVSQLL